MYVLRWKQIVGGRPITGIVVLPPFSARIHLIATSSDDDTVILSASRHGGQSSADGRPRARALSFETLAAGAAH